MKLLAMRSQGKVKQLTAQEGGYHASNRIAKQNYQEIAVFSVADPVWIRLPRAFPCHITIQDT
jgi:hypothetical protein